MQSSTNIERTQRTRKANRDTINREPVRRKRDNERKALRRLKRDSISQGA